MSRHADAPLWHTRREAFFYLLPVGVALALWVLFAVDAGLPDTPADALDTVVSLVLIGLLWVRRRHPTALLAATLAVSALYLVLMTWGAGFFSPDLDFASPWVPLATPVIVYNAVLHAGPVVGTALAAALYLVAARPWEVSTDVILGAVTMVVLPALIGLYLRAHRTLVRALTDRAERAEREQHLLAERARADERVRLAEEMHDVVTHRVSLMVLHAGALGVTAPDERVRAAAEGLRAAGCEALDELRELVGVLRNHQRADIDTDEPGEVDPGAVPDLSTLLAESASVGVPVELVREGNPALTSPAVGRTAYRVVQESLTNIRKHAPGAPTRVHVRYGGDRVRLTVRNDRATAPVDRGLSRTGSGAGLAGLRQRVELVGGTLTAGPRAGGGFEVDVVLPAYVPAGAER
ncbi:two-component system sensor kinase [Actinokineospora spheciospongiae]|uniref:histidine kinase n=1 Tax=Actinokineospora spheciospongiae TaxID=909613 RepID=W7IE33_9PSEU|nr:histidine kinase [Actinokineospora spheciospongiae]EWC58828.1 two-component system sensor kinase [Actinokineospora spheciospongiae]